MKYILAEVSIFCLWTNWIHLVTCSKIEFRELHCYSRCWTKSLKLTLSIAVHRGGLAKNDFWLVVKQKKKIGEQLNYFWNMCPKPFSWTKNKRKLFSDGKSRGPLLAGAALNHIAKENYQLISWSELISEGRSWKSLANGRSRADPSILQVFSDYLIASWDLYLIMFKAWRGRQPGNLRREVGEDPGN